jgi:Xaa-Pro aminopeptidase
VLYIDGKKLTNQVRHTLEELADVREMGVLAADFAAFKGKTVLLDRATASDALARLTAAEGGKITRGTDPIALMKAIKNDAEIEGTRTAHVRDGVAMARFLAWFEKEAPSGKLTEIDAASALESFRRDSGGQYVDGTTDITRTAPIGEPTDEMRDRFTRVLKGHIAIATAVFPKGTRGSQLDSFARRPLWEAGLDYAHGTGHGVGSFLSVHEGPQRISPVGSSQSGGDEPLQAGMIISNEPGYYKTGEYGIRIENLVLVVPREIEGAEKEMLGFETLTFAPIDRRLIDAQMLEPEELVWLNCYHAHVLAKIGPQLQGDDLAWLQAACAPILSCFG